MAEEQSKQEGPDLTQGVPLRSIPESGLLLGHVGDEAVVLARSGEEIFAVGATCTHYMGPLGKGIVVGDTIRCPWHHACFSLRTGEAVGPPAFDSISCWPVECRDGTVFVRNRPMDENEKPANRPLPAEQPQRIVIVGGGAAGFAAAEMLRRRGFGGELTVLSADDAAPYDRPNLSKDYLAGEAPEEWIPLRPPKFYQANRIDLRLSTRADRVDTQARAVLCVDGQRFPFDRLLLATGAEPRKLSIPGSDLPHVFTLRSLDDSRAIIERAKDTRRAVVLGASFIGLEAAAALRARDIEVHVVAPDRRPMEKVLGPEIGDLIRSLHEKHGVVFHLEESATAIDASTVTLKGGGRLDADLVVVGIGVSPRTELAERSGLAIDHGVVVDEYLETSVPGIFAAGDIARWPDAHTGGTLRVEHWVVAERLGQTAAFNMLGLRRRHTAVPFFWSKHYDLSIRYVGHAQQWDEIEIDGSIAKRDCIARFRKSGRTLAVATIGRDREALRAEAAMEKEMVPTG
jgi:NADPH-dependent 2,4-dienoyl-CoA reductase/sulfur reductase-like enzyme/nitrite reductase/ring-hydroxylating ferredoxin subunit